MFSHVTVGASDLERAVKFYDQVLATLGLTRQRTHKSAAGYAPPDFNGIELPFWVVQPFDRGPATAGNGTMIAFEAGQRSAVDNFHAAALAAGGKDEGAPGLRRYHPNFYAAYVRDLDGNKLCVVCHHPSALAQ